MKKVESGSSRRSRDGARPVARARRTTGGRTSPDAFLSLDLLDRVRAEAEVSHWAWDTRTSKAHLEPTWCAILGYPQGEFPDTVERAVELVHPDDRPAISEAARACLSRETPTLELCHRVLRADGTSLWCWTRGHLIANEGEAPLLAGCTLLLTANAETHPFLRELEEARRVAHVERAAREHAERLALQTADAAGIDGQQPFFEELVRQLSGMVPHRMIAVCEHTEEPRGARVLACWLNGKLDPTLRAYPVEGTPCARTWSRDIVHHQRDLQTAYPNDTMIKELGLHSYIGVPFWDSSGRIVGHLAVLHDQPLDLDSLPPIRVCASRAGSQWELRREMEQRHSTERRLRLISTIADQVETGILITDPGNGATGDGPLVEYVNPGLLRIFELDSPSSLLNQPAFAVIPRLAPHFRIARSKNASHDSEIEHVTSSGSHRFLHVRYRPLLDESGTMMNWAVLAIDITEVKDAIERQRRLANELAHVSRISMLGVMATGLAHELNQPLASIGSFAFACRQQIPPGMPERDLVVSYLEKIEGQRTRAAEVIGRIRAFVRKGDTRYERHSVNGLITEALRYLHGGRPPVEVVLRLDSSDPHAFVDRIQFHQVVLNLVLNASEATANAGWEPRPIEIETALRKEDRIVFVSVIDSGPGMSDQVLEHAFDAFFTTRAEGLGMGLPICKTIVEAHEGRLWAERRPQGGMRLCFTLPFREE